MVLVLTVVVLQSISFANYALTTKTTNIIYGSAPYLTFDGGRTRVTNTEALLRISLSDGRTFTPTTTNSRDNPIILPVDGQSFNDIGMLVPTNTNSIALSSLIGTPYNYWGDDDGDGQGVNGVTATGSLNVSIADNFNNPVARNEVLTICKAPYKLTLSNGEGTLTTRYGVPNESRFSAGNATYYINPKASPVICFARPNLSSSSVASSRSSGLSAAIWNRDKGFLTQSVTPSSYGLNFPTTGANNLFFDLDIDGNNQVLSWAPVSHGGITATMTNSTSTSVRVTLTGPVATPSQWQSQYGGRIDKPSLPQTFELVGRDSSGNAVVKYGFVLKKWVVNRGTYMNTALSLRLWCSNGYRVPKVRDLTNASCLSSGTSCTEYYTNKPVKGATPSSPDNTVRRHIGAGFFTEWGRMDYYTGANFKTHYYWTTDLRTRKHGGMIDDVSHPFAVLSANGYVRALSPDGERTYPGLCVYP
ncbi:hypothetical protein [Gilliamella apis]|uniref:hypothetical protein n=1 Tax=Gilliamella apis TaxID=1970738 RepID=UPI000A34E26B|nr:hypothetical protein [Gilliamella apis]OTQ60961.1 hypothetical protein B6C98_07070 [Gilliamella apis]OTQ62489.1 hypothetical protein B6D09_10955 [Gilliamella apis]OTQ65015.1 hypothetical protein B6C89_10235 [Gilliamella apis]OTQ66575.1 hypothetical protein B6D10_09995 [Gilliamella apis]